MSRRRSSSWTRRRMSASVSSGRSSASVPSGPSPKACMLMDDAASKIELCDMRMKMGMLLLLAI